MVRKIILGVFIFLVFITHTYGVYTKRLDIRFSSQNISEFYASNISTYYGKDGILLSNPIVNLISGNELLVSWIETFPDGIIISTVNPNNIYILYRGELRQVGTFPNHSIVTKVKNIRNSVYVLTGEKASIYQFYVLNSDQVVLFDDSYVWDIFEFNGKLYAITGNGAKLYEVSRNNYKQIFEGVNEKHFLVALVDKDVVYIGSSGTGTIYVFDGNKVYPFVSLKDSEITDIKKYGNFLIVSTYNITPFQQNQQQSQQDRPSQPLPSNILRSTSGNIYKINLNTKQVELLFSELGITSIDVYGDKILATTIDGKLVEYSLDGEGIKYSFYSKNFLKLFRVSNDIYISTANPMGVDFVSFSKSSLEGYVETKEIEVGFVENWGRVKYEGEIPKGGYVKIFIKGGNTPKEDETWSKWVEVKEFVNLDKYQYIKLKVVLGASDLRFSPMLSKLTIFYTPKNSKPSISSISVSQQNDMINIEWKSSDPDGDKLRFNVFIRNYNEISWQQLNKEPIFENKFSINKYLLGNGIFSFMVVADDSVSNPKGRELFATNFFENFVVDVIPPYVDRGSVKVSKSKESNKLEFRVVDNFFIKEVFYSVDGVNWEYILPVDGVLDSSSELFSISLDMSVKVILLKIVDESGNINTERIQIY